jgi:8-oxo-dGTP pyrophosphatase MutT (NUDIX family)
MKIDISTLKKIITKSAVPGPPATGDYKSACVFLLLFNPGDLQLLAIQKTDSEGYPWRNQVALPGGHLDDEDASPLEGAFRELEEEVSIPRSEVELFGSLGHFQTINHRDIEVFSGLWHGTGPIRWDPAEISRVLEIPLRSLVATHITGNFHGHIPDVQQLRYPYGDVVIWGATARILHHFIELLYPLLEGDSRQAD